MTRSSSASSPSSRMRSSKATSARSTPPIFASASTHRASSSRRRTVPDRNAFSYAVYRLIPNLERGERLNVGVIVFSRPPGFLGLRTHLDEQRLAGLAPDFEAAPVHDQLKA